MTARLLPPFAFAFLTTLQTVTFTEGTITKYTCRAKPVKILSYRAGTIYWHYEHKIDLCEKLKRETGYLANTACDLAKVNQVSKGDKQKERTLVCSSFQSTSGAQINNCESFDAYFKVHGTFDKQTGYVYSTLTIQNDVPGKYWCTSEEAKMKIMKGGFEEKKMKEERKWGEGPTEVNIAGTRDWNEKKSGEKDNGSSAHVITMNKMVSFSSIMLILLLKLRIE